MYRPTSKIRLVDWLFNSISNLVDRSTTKVVAIAINPDRRHYCSAIHKGLICVALVCVKIVTNVVTKFRSLHKLSINRQPHSCCLSSLLLLSSPTALLTTTFLRCRVKLYASYDEIKLWLDRSNLVGFIHSDVCVDT